MLNNHFLLFIVILLLKSCSLEDFYSSKYDISDFDKMEIEGRDIYYLKKHKENEKVKKILESLPESFQLMDKYMLTKKDKLKWAKKIKYFIESDVDLMKNAGVDNYTAWYNNDHPWLIRKGFIKEKADNICLNILWYGSGSDSKLVTLMHETAHAYHFQIIGIEAADIINAYENSKIKNYYNGNNETNFKEYFAMITEQYFGKLAGVDGVWDIQKKDPEGYETIKKYWLD